MTSATEMDRAMQSVLQLCNVWHLSETDTGMSVSYYDLYRQMG